MAKLPCPANCHSACMARQGVTWLRATWPTSYSRRRWLFCRCRPSFLLSSCCMQFVGSRPPPPQDHVFILLCNANRRPFVEPPSPACQPMNCCQSIDKDVADSCRRPYTRRFFALSVPFILVLDVSWRCAPSVGRSPVHLLFAGTTRVAHPSCTVPSAAVHLLPIPAVLARWRWRCCWHETLTQLPQPAKVPVAGGPNDCLSSACPARLPCSSPPYVSSPRRCAISLCTGKPAACVFLQK